MAAEIGHVLHICYQGTTNSIQKESWDLGESRCHPGRIENLAGSLDRADGQCST